jgi:hypothetical protein
METYMRTSMLGIIGAALLAFTAVSASSAVARGPGGGGPPGLAGDGPPGFAGSRPGF